MDLSRSESRAFSFAVSAMLTSAVLATAPNPTFVAAAAGPQPAAIMGMIEGARSAGFAGMKDMPAPAAVASPAAEKAGPKAAQAKPTLTPAQLQKLRDFALSPRGKSMNLTGVVALPLGVGPGDRDSFFPGLGAVDDDVHTRWVLWVLPNDSGYVIGRGDTVNTSQRYFRMDKDMHMILGLSRATDQANPVAIPPAEAAQLFASDLTEWVDVADAITP